jgi:hypothetical protein
LIVGTHSGSYVGSFSTNIDYYKVVTDPIDFTRIQQKVKTEEYQNVQALSNDMKLLCDNAKAYFKVVFIFIAFILPLPCTAGLNRVQ